MLQLAKSFNPPNFSTICNFFTNHLWLWYSLFLILEVSTSLNNVTFIRLCSHWGFSGYLRPHRASARI